MDTVRKGDALEYAVYNYFSAQVADDKLVWKKECCRVFHKKAYYSRDRERNIVFDVSIEFWLPGAQDYSFIWLIECKNYSGSVPVNDVEEFFTKVEQVAAANGKAIMISNSPFDVGGINFARNKKMGIIRYLDPSRVKWELMRSPSAMIRSTSLTSSEHVMAGLCSREFMNHGFDLYMQGPTGVTNSLWQFALSMLSEVPVSESELVHARNHKGRNAVAVPYVELEDMEERTQALLDAISYKDGPVPLDLICAGEEKRAGLKVIFDEFSDKDNRILGKISFSPLTIHIYRQKVENLGRARFTLAHELAHLFLSHGEYMLGEVCEEDDLMLPRDSDCYAPDVARMEFQANIFASCLLMPKAHFLNDFRRIVRWLGIHNKGFGDLYLDNQPCNYHNYTVVTRELMGRYGVSRAAAAIRLQAMGLLRDERNIENWTPSYSLLRSLVRSF